MNILEKLLAGSIHSAENKTVKTVTLGVNYCAVQICNRHAGLSWTWSHQDCCGQDKERFTDYEGMPAVELLKNLTVSSPSSRSMAMALLNALNSERAEKFPHDYDNSTVFDTLNLKKNSRLVMVGFFRPVVKLLQEKGVDIYIADKGNNMGDEEELTDRLNSWAEAAILSSTSIVNGTYDSLISMCGKRYPVAMLGPTTPLFPEIFKDYGVSILAGSVVNDSDMIMKLIRQGAGTPDFKHYTKKVYVKI
ncbi:MAG TPA: DUF364 domain-containing protein [Clostridiales bacterium]|nr:DUF364 domain-containing protein [Clostridiales bacterium]HQP69768.1 DUF364 domain-containing protein [Clostridiales bacterium]